MGTAPGDTIFALASGRGRAGVALVRVSGPGAGPALAALAGGMPPPRTAQLARLSDAAGEPIDHALVLWFPGPASFTGEDVAEFHVHGGPAVLSALAAALAARRGVRPAEAGEFTRRAFLNDKLDLTEVEGLADLIAAETAAQRRQALRQMDGALGRLYAGWRDGLVRALAHLEAAIDFPDEDLDPGVEAAVDAEARTLRDALSAHLADGAKGERLREGLSIAIVGPPNVGKSSLLNALAGRDAAIVADVAGTTRDVIEVHLDLGGWPALVADTAGLRAAVDAVEAEGVRRATDRARAADLKLVLVDAREWPAVPPEIAALIDADALVVANKIDLAPAAPLARGPDGRRPLALSVRSGAGLDDLMAALAAEAASRLAAGEAPVLTRARHRAAVDEAREALDRFLAGGGRRAVELRAEDLRQAVRAIGRILGRVDIEEVLDVVFADFCIGK
jgi:tRNA modification GTPase